jgi:hypothetical protein
MNNTNTIIILFSIIAIVLLMGCTSQPSNNVVSNQTNESNKNVTQTTGSNVSNISTTTTGSNASNASAAACSDKQCFITAANKCGNETIQITESYGVVKYSTSGCIFTKTVISLAQNESADIKRIIESKSMTCLYKKGEFDQDWTSSLVLGVEKCTGGLKDAIIDLLAFA